MRFLWEGRFGRAIPLATVFLLLTVGILGGCSDDEAESTVLVVMAPAPLQGFLTTAKTLFEAEHPGVTIELNLAHVPSLITQLESGVAGDVMVTPDAGSIGNAGQKGLLASEVSAVARIPLALVVPAGNPGAVQGVAALADSALTVAVCAAELPCGKLAIALGEKNGLVLAPDTLEPGGSPGVVTKATTGEIDVGLVLLIDVAGGGDRVELIRIPAAENVLSQVSAATLASSGNPALAAEFLAFLLGAECQEAAADLEMLPPADA